MGSHTITSRTPGVFYHRPSPDADPYVTEGVFNHVEVKPFMQVFPEA